MNPAAASRPVSSSGEAISGGVKELGVGILAGQIGSEPDYVVGRRVVVDPPYRDWVVIVVADIAHDYLPYSPALMGELASKL